MKLVLKTILVSILRRSAEMASFDFVAGDCGSWLCHICTNASMELPDEEG